jgi:hypothetical protein
VVVFDLQTHLRRWGLCGLVAVLLASSCLLVGVSAAEAGLVFKRPGGSAIPFTGTLRAWCGPWDDEVARPSVHVELRNARRGWELSAVRHDLEVSRRINFPNEFVSKRPRGVLLFVAASAIEASTAEEESSGSLVFSRVSCRLGGVVEFSIDALLGSELFNGKSVRVSGTYRGHVSKRPELWPVRRSAARFVG